MDTVTQQTFFGEMEHDNLYGRFYVNAESDWNELGKYIKIHIQEFLDPSPNEVEMNDDDDGFDISRKPEEFEAEVVTMGEPVAAMAVEKRKRNDEDESESEDDESDPFGSPPAKKGPRTFGGDAKIDTLINYFDFGIPDTMHDFGGTRNDAFPSNPSPGNFLNEAKKFLTYQDLEYEYDPLKMYYEGNFNDFEKRVKIDYILGKLCDVYGINFFFNQNIKDYAKINADILAPLEENKPNKLSFFYETNLKNQGYTYYFLDACMSIQCDPEFKSQMTTLKSLCDLWDPVGASELDESDMAEKMENLNIKFTLEENGVYNALFFDGKTDKSLYDEAYDPLLNVKCLEKFGIRFKLRLKQQIKANKYIVNIYIVHEKTGKKASFPLKNGGFTLHALAVGLAYVSSDYKNANIDADLETIITYIRNIEPSITPDDFKRMLTRFKSSGDHGSARTASLVNKYCGNAKDKTIYLSGDQLCYVYSMLIGNPTLFRYYAPNKPLTDQGETCEVCMPDRIHFLGFFSPQKTTRFYTNIIQRCNGFIKTYLTKLFSSGKATTPNVLTLVQIENYSATVETFTKEGYNESLHKDPLDTIISELSFSFDAILTNIPTAGNLDEVAKVLLAMENLLHSIYYLMNAETFISEYKKVFATQQQMIDNIMKKDDNPQSRPKRNQPQGITIDNTFLNSINAFNGLKTTKKYSGTFSSFLSSKNTAFYDKMMAAKKNFSKIMPSFFSGLKTSVGPASAVVNDKLVKQLAKDELQRSLDLDNIDKSYASAIIELYGLPDLKGGNFERRTRKTRKLKQGKLKQGKLKPTFTKRKRGNFTRSKRTKSLKRR